ncbi:Phage-related protein [plant metagenome]|uniref:Phage-related protein n=1 Tax=plant metagenome TaxID=1297885 RepID=A0A484QM79_9ZZZZ
MKLLDIFKRKPAPAPAPRRGLFSTHPLGDKVQPKFQMPTFEQPNGAPGVAYDNGYIGERPSPKMASFTPVNEAQLGFYAAGSLFIGYQACAMLATNWLIDKACNMPARDAVRNGYLVTCGSEDIAAKLSRTDKKYAVKKHLRELVHFGRVYGGRIVLFDVQAENPEEFYKAPFNLDGIQPGSYKGMSQIDPNWVTPVLTDDNLRDPASQTYYEPTYWRIKDRVYHKSHLRIFVPYPVPDYLKPHYRYMGVSVPQRMMERAYAAERSANEGPQLLMTKRLTSLGVGDAALTNREALEKNLAEWVAYRDNYGVRVNGADETIQQFDTALADVDTVIMTQFQLAAAVANVPATKLLGTQPKGFNASGEYERSVYREDLESIQSNDMSPLLERHYQLVAKSTQTELPEGIEIQWLPVDSPTAKEWAEIDKLKADRDGVLFNTGAVDAEDIRNRLREDRDSDYHNIEEAEFVDGEANGHEAPPAVGPGAPGPAVQGPGAGLPGGGGAAIPRQS